MAEELNAISLTIATDVLDQGAQMLGNDLRIVKIQSTSKIMEMRAEWDACIAETNADVFFMSDWVDSWFRHCTIGKEFIGLCFYSGDRLVGVLPFYIDRIFFGFSVAKIAATDMNYAVLSLPILEEYAEAVLARSFTILISELGCQAVVMSPLSALCPALTSTESIAMRMGLRRLTSSSRSHMIVPLPESLEKYVAGLSSKRRKNYRRDRSAAQKGHGMVRKMATEETASECLEAFIDMHQSQWKAIGKGGHFGDWPLNAALYRDLVPRLIGSGHAVIHELWVDNQRVASQLGFKNKDWFYWRLTARVIGRDSDVMSLGSLGIMDCVAFIIENGIYQIEDGAGNYAYKTSGGGELVSLTGIIIHPKGSLSILRLKVFIVFSKLLNLLYYSIWFKKIRPHWQILTGAKPRPLWRVWIRTRL